MKKINFLLIGCLGFSTISFAKEEIVVDHLNRTILNKTFNIKHGNENILISQKFLVVGQNELLYLRGSSSKDTLKYGEEKCKSEGKILDIDYGSRVVKKDVKYLLSCSNPIDFKSNITEKINSSIKKEENHPGFKDEYYYNNYGEKIITRTSENISPSGKKYILQQKFQEISPEKLLYIPNSSTQETLQYNNEVCKAINGIDASDKGVRIIQKNTTSVLVCNDIKKSKTEIDKILSQRQACNIQSISYSNYNGITGANNPIAGDILYQNATGSLLRRIEIGGYYNEAIDNLNNESGYSRIFLTVYIGSSGTYPFYTIGRLGCTSTSQGVLVTT